MYGCKRWIIKKAECQIINAFELRCWRRLLRVPWTARKSNQSILKEINREYSLDGLTLKLKLQYFGHLMWRADSLEKTLMLGKLKAGREGDDRGCNGWMASLTQWTWVWASSRRWWRTGKPGMLQSMGSQRVLHDRVTEQQQQQAIRPIFPSEEQEASLILTSFFLEWHFVSRKLLTAQIYVFLKILLLFQFWRLHYPKVPPFAHKQFQHLTEIYLI